MPKHDLMSLINQTDKAHFFDEQQEANRVCRNCGERYGKHYGLSCPIKRIDGERTLFIDSGNVRKAKNSTTTYRKEVTADDNYEVRCAICGRRRGQHFSTATYIFCNYKDLKCYKETGAVTGPRFISVIGQKEQQLHKYKPEIAKNAKVLMAVADKFMNEGGIGVVKFREDNSAQVYWNNGTIYFHSVGNLTLLKDSKDPNIIFLTRKNI